LNFQSWIDPRNVLEECLFFTEFKSKYNIVTDKITFKVAACILVRWSQ